MWKLMCVTLALLIFVKVCAHGPLHPRVLGGTDTVQGVWPWMASLHISPNYKSHFCGGSLINTEWVLSAAHCFISGSKFTVVVLNLRVYLGRWTQQMANNQEIVSHVHSIHTHPYYDEKNFNNDIALLHLSTPVNFTPYISPVNLAAQGSVIPSNTQSWIIGWGQTASIGFFCMCPKDLPYPETLQQAIVFVVNNDMCHEQLKNLWTNPRITDNMICAGTPSGGVDTYCGDSGGPLMNLQCSQQWVQSGITSFGYSCAKRNKPGVYTRISQYEQWITSTIQTHSSQTLTTTFVPLNLPCSSAG